MFILVYQTFPEYAQNYGWFGCNIYINVVHIHLSLNCDWRPPIKSRPEPKYRVAECSLKTEGGVNVVVVVDLIEIRNTLEYADVREGILSLARVYLRI